MIVIVGLGALGTRVCKEIPAGTELLLIDFDTVSEENIGNQFPREVLGMSKVEACRILWQPEANVLRKHIDVTTAALLKDASLVIDCTDNMLTRYIINDYCTREGIPWVHTAMSDTMGTVAVFEPNGPCFACVYPDGKGLTCSRSFNRAVADHTAAIAVQEALRTERKPVFVRVYAADIMVLEMAVRKDCPAHNGNYIYLSQKPQSFYITYCSNHQCMAAKPLKHHDLGASRELTVDGKRVTLFANGELHFHDTADDDELYALAQHVYATAVKR
jgi:molybdopterin/thiamine biosynthesis adenylyltransferase